MTTTIFEKFPILSTIPKERFPKHLAIIPDGNGRWAKKKNAFVTVGHTKGFDVAEKVLTDLSEILEIHIVTMWGFSSDNWKRSEKEVAGLMFIFGRMLKKILREFNQRNRRFVHIGRKDRLPKSLFSQIEKAEKETADNTGQIFCLALDFGGDDQTLRMLQKVQKMDKDIPLTLETMRGLRDGNGFIPPSDLLIRTSGELRTSDIGWLNGSPTELYVIDALFPDVQTKDIIEAIVDFSLRERRFGGRTTPKSDDKTQKKIEQK